MAETVKNEEFPPGQGGTTVPRSSFPDLTNKLKRLAWIPLWRRQVRVEIQQGIGRMMVERGHAPIDSQHRCEEFVDVDDLISGRLL
ncbi:MAG TPA: hypothetical protein VK716_17805 [Terracidiphilus sp.]|nr:hypothetical protein [Terracidiphilus sp.]